MEKLVERSLRYLADKYLSIAEFVMHVGIELNRVNQLCQYNQCNQHNQSRKIYPPNNMILPS